MNVSFDGLHFRPLQQGSSNTQSRTVSCSVCSTSSRRATLLILSKWPSNQLTDFASRHETDVPFTSHLFHSRNAFIYLKVPTDLKSVASVSLNRRGPFRSCRANSRWRVLCATDSLPSRTFWSRFGLVVYFRASRSVSVPLSSLAFSGGAAIGERNSRGAAATHFPSLRTESNRFSRIRHSECD